MLFLVSILALLRILLLLCKRSIEGRFGHAHSAAVSTLTVVISALEATLTVSVVSSLIAALTVSVVSSLVAALAVSIISSLIAALTVSVVSSLVAALAVSIKIGRASCRERV